MEHHPTAHKREVKKYLVGKATNLYSEDQLQQELHKIKIILRDDGYPEEFSNNPHRNTIPLDDGNV